MNPDIMNGAFELFASAMIFMHSRRLWLDKKVMGASTVATAFFTAWGFWNLFYYPTLDQIWSFAGGVCVVLANTVWLFLMLKYRNR